MTFYFLVINQDFLIFTLSLCPISPFLHRKKHYFRKEFLDDTYFFTLFELSRPSHNTTSQNIGGTNAWAIPHLKVWGDLPPSPPPRSPPLSENNILRPRSKTQIFLKQFLQKVS